MNFSGKSPIPGHFRQFLDKPPWAQGRRKHLKLGGARHFEGTFFLRKKALSKNEKGTSLFIAKSWKGTCPQCPPVPTSMPGRHVPVPLRGYVLPPLGPRLWPRGPDVSEISALNFQNVTMNYIGFNWKYFNQISPNHNVSVFDVTVDTGFCTTFKAFKLLLPCSSHTASCFSFDNMAGARGNCQLRVFTEYWVTTFYKANVKALAFYKLQMKLEI